MPRVEIYPYPFWPPPGFPYRFPYGAYPPLWWWYPPYEYPLPPSAGTIEATGYGWVEFTVAPKGAAIVVDGYYVGVVDDFDGHQLMLVPGPHRIELQASGFTAMTYNVNVERGRSIVLHSKLEPAQTTEK